MQDKQTMWRHACVHDRSATWKGGGGGGTLSEVLQTTFISRHEETTFNSVDGMHAELWAKNKKRYGQTFLFKAISEAHRDKSQPWSWLGETLTWWDHDMHTLYKQSSLILDQMLITIALG